jgi:hypothetical protein
VGNTVGGVKEDLFMGIVKQRLGSREPQVFGFEPELRLFVHLPETVIGTVASAAKVNDEVLH